MTPLRIVDATGKATFVVVAFAVGVTLSVGGALVSGVVGWALGGIALVGAIVVAARVFRGGDEPVAPRRNWWRMTASPAAGWVMCALLAASAVGNLASPIGMPALAVAPVQLLLAAAYAYSSLRLRRS
jgi:hypothetical protein